MKIVRVVIAQILAGCLVAYLILRKGGIEKAYEELLRIERKERLDKLYGRA